MADPQYERAGTVNGLPLFKMAADGSIDPAERRRLLGLSEHADELAVHGETLRKRGHYSAAEVAFRRACADTPDNAYLLNGLGASLWFQSEHAEAEHCYRRALHLNPADAGTYSNYGTLLSSLGRTVEMRRSFAKALEIEDSDSTKWNYAMALLDHGMWSEAWPLYDVRMRYKGAPQYCKLPYPTWKGEDLSGKRLFVMCEQGYGDRLLFTRYFSWIHENWPTARISYIPDVPPMPDMRLVLWNYGDFVDFLVPGAPFPEADYGIYLMSLPGVHGTNPYNVPPPDGVVGSMLVTNNVELPEPRRPGVKVGICWTGNPLMMGNRDRSIPFEMMLELAEDPDVTLYGIQFSPGRGDIQKFGAGEFVCDLADDINAHGGFLATGAAMAKMDLVITVCTANAHLAGTLGVPCWTLLCHDPYWTWLRGRSDSVWYPETRLFRQPRPGDWRSVIDEVRGELGRFARDKLNQKEATDVVSQSRCA